jgi:hypothetical protein
MFDEVKGGNLVGWRDVVARFEDDRAAAASDTEFVPDTLIIAPKGETSAQYSRAYQV